MGIDAMLHLLTVGTVAASAGTLLVLAVRLPLRTLFGARLAYLAWAVLPLVMIAAVLPAPAWMRSVRQDVAPQRLVASATADATPSLRLLRAAAAPASGVDWTLLIVATWASGALLLAVHTARRQRRFVAGLGPRRDRGDGSFEAPGAREPMVIGVLRPRIVVPEDFDVRYTPSQGALVIAHERCHVARRDVAAQFAFALLRCLQWFNPLVHRAEARFRIDQELACDAAVLARHPTARRAYGDALLNTQLAHPGLPVGCHWQSGTHLKERILMLKQPSCSPLRRRIGLCVLSLALATAAASAWALQPADINRAPVYLGTQLRGTMANVDIKSDKTAGTLEIIAPSTGRAADGTPRVYMNGVSPLQVMFGEGTGRLTFEAQVTNTVADDPVVVWTLEQRGKRVDQGRLNLSQAQQVVIGGAARGMASSATLTFRAQTERAILGAAEKPVPMETDGGGDYRVEDGVLIGPDSKLSGVVDLALHVSATGAVTGFDIERESTPGGLSQEALEDYANGFAFSPRIEKGRAVATSVHATVHFAPSFAEVQDPPSWLKAQLAAAKDASSPRD